MHIGRPEEARATLRRFGSVIVTETDDWDEEAKIHHSHLPPVDKRYLGTTVALTVAALSWGFVNFGLLLWLPGELISEGRDMGVAAAIIARSSFIAVPVVAVAAVLYSRWSTKGALARDDRSYGAGVDHRHAAPKRTAGRLRPGRGEWRCSSSARPARYRSCSLLGRRTIPCASAGALRDGLQDAARSGGLHLPGLSALGAGARDRNRRAMAIRRAGARGARAGRLLRPRNPRAGFAGVGANLRARLIADPGALTGNTSMTGGQDCQTIRCLRRWTLPLFSLRWLFDCPGVASRTK